MNRTAYASSPATVLRSLEPGDAWHYQAAGSMTPARGDPVAVSGTIAVSVAPNSLSDAPGALALVFAQQLEVIRPGGVREALPAPAWMFWFVQDAATKDVAIVADNMGQGGGCRRAKTPQIFYPGSWSGNTGYANRLDFGEGDFVSNALAVRGQERIETPAGVYLSWIAGITSESSAMGLITGTDWWTPELGAPVRFETDSTMPDAARLRLQATLTSTSVVPDGLGPSRHSAT